MNIKESDWKIRLIQSTYGSYDKPADLCSLVKQLAISILVLPFTYISHISNIITKGPNMPGWIGALMLLFGFAFTVVAVDANADYSNLEIMKVGYVLAPVMIILLTVCVAATLGILYLFSISYNYMWDNILKKTFKPTKEKTAKEPNWLVLYCKGIKDRYCVKINYEGIKVESADDNKMVNE